MKVCFAGNLSSTFVKKDYEILKKHFRVDALKVPHKKFPSIEWLKFLIEVVKKAKRCDIAFSWFAGLYSALVVFIFKLFRKKSIVVVGGWDVENMPEISYGAFTNIKEKIPARYVIDNASLLLPFSEYAVKRLKILKAKAPYKKVDLYCDIYKFHPEGEKENIVLTVGGVKWNNLKRKGLENFVRAAKYLPEVKFILVGKWIDDSINYLRSTASPNVEFTGFLPEEDLIKLYQRAKVYCQLSYQEGEGAGGAVGEAMACECIPVVSDRAIALKETVDDIAFYAPYGDHKRTAEIIREALNAPDELGKKARERMVKLFPPEKREKELKEIIERSVQEDFLSQGYVVTQFSSRS